MLWKYCAHNTFLFKMLNHKILNLYLDFPKFSFNFFFLVERFSFFLFFFEEKFSLNLHHQIIFHLTNSTHFEKLDGLFSGWGWLCWRVMLLTLEGLSCVWIRAKLKSQNPKLIHIGCQIWKKALKKNSTLSPINYHAISIIYCRELTLLLFTT